MRGAHACFAAFSKGGEQLGWIGKGGSAGRGAHVDSEASDRLHSKAVSMHVWICLKHRSRAGRQHCICLPRPQNKLSVAELLRFDP